jgi:hypothetical protein
MIGDSRAVYRDKRRMERYPGGVYQKVLSETAGSNRREVKGLYE